MKARIRLSDDAGTTLLELLVGMILMGIFMSIFVGSLVSMTSAQSKTQSIAQTSQNLDQGFQSLDKTVRYASAISTPGTGSPSGDWYVEFSTTTTGSQVCTQLRVDNSTNELQRRTWTVANSTASGLTGWTPLASEITNGTATAGTSQPFIRVTPGATSDFQQLTVTLASLAGPANGPTTSGTSFTITAVNSSLPATTICQEAGRP
jgi:type II secretory pathway pseudopilin PulG